MATALQLIKSESVC